MILPEYVTVDEVRRVCKELEICDWTVITEADVTIEDAAVILSEVNTSGMDIDVEDFRQGLAVELEHGIRYVDADVTNNHPILTGKIVLAHLRETLDYYQRLDVAEVEGDLMKAVLAGDLEKIKNKYKKLIEVKGALHRVVSEQFQ